MIRLEYDVVLVLSLYDTEGKKKTYVSSKNSIIGLKCKKIIRYNMDKKPFLSSYEEVKE